LSPLLNAGFGVLATFMCKSVPQGSATTVWCVAASELKGGEYCQDCNISKTTEIANNIEEGKKLWDFSEKETGVVFPEIKTDLIENK